ncbi:adrenocorticotropic hormone receptor-like [Hydra vulgaris]|uniref:Adrenocorticotropic hormone receptor-like n=1 Tax=Hydra vulgaris TaxID=6087 RepID=A0ABM4BRI9_HYDVU
MCDNMTNNSYCANESNWNTQGKGLGCNNMMKNSYCVNEGVWKTQEVDIAFSSIGVFVCAIGIYILNKMKDKNFDKTQRYIITNLCIFDACSCFVLTVNSSIFVSNEITEDISQLFANIFMLGYYGATLWLVFDRYLHIKLNLKYVVYWSKKKTSVFTFVLWTFCILAGANLQIFCQRVIYILMILFDVIIVVFSIFVYATALKIYQKSKLIKANQKNVFKKPQRNVFKGMLIASLILLSFLLLSVIPDIIIISTFNSINSWSLPKFSYLNISYIVAMWIDALSYVVVYPESLVFLRNRRFSLRSISTTSIKTESLREISIATIDT